MKRIKKEKDRVRAIVSPSMCNINSLNHPRLYFELLTNGMLFNGALSVNIATPLIEAVKL